MSSYEKNDWVKYVVWTTTIFVTIAVAAVSIMLLMKLGGYMFDTEQTNHTSLSDRSLDVCKEQGGTPVLEENGEAYKSCTVKGVTNVTSNKVN